MLDREGPRKIFGKISLPGNALFSPFLFSIKLLKLSGEKKPTKLHDDT